MITAIGQHATPTASDLLSVLAGERPGDTVTVRLTRVGSAVQVTVKLGELPASQG